jgi:hypothetical protein
MMKVDPENSATPEQTIFEKHVYDIDVMDAFRSLVKSFEGHETTVTGIPVNEYLNRINEGLIAFARSHRIYLPALYTDGSIIVYSSDCYYPHALALTLMTLPKHRIHSLLDYQFRNFEGNHYAEKDNFVGLLEFHIAYFLERNSPFDASDLLDRIMEWVRNIRDKSVENPTKHVVLISEAFAEDLSIQLVPFFPHDAEKEILDTLLGKTLGKGLRFDGPINRLVELFKRIRLYEKMTAPNDQLAGWIAENFQYFDDKKKDYFTPNTNTILSILTKKGKEPTKNNLILKHLFGYKSK